MCVFDSYRFNRLDTLPIDSGIDPVSWLLCRYLVVSQVHKKLEALDCCSYVPLRLSCVLDSYKFNRLRTLPIESGIDPVSWLLFRYLPIHYRQLLLVSVLHCTTVCYVVVSGLSRTHTGERVEASCRSTRVSIRSVDYCSDIWACNRQLAQLMCTACFSCRLCLPDALA
jgi:hypothetical protein